MVDRRRRARRAPEQQVARAAASRRDRGGLLVLRDGVVRQATCRRPARRPWSGRSSPRRSGRRRPSGRARRSARGRRRSRADAAGRGGRGRGRGRGGRGRRGGRRACGSGSLGVGVVGCGAGARPAPGSAWSCGVLLLPASWAACSAASCGGSLGGGRGGRLGGRGLERGLAALGQVAADVLEPRELGDQGVLLLRDRAGLGGGGVGGGARGVAGLAGLDLQLPRPCRGRRLGLLGGHVGQGRGGAELVVLAVERVLGALQVVVRSITVLDAVGAEASRRARSASGASWYDVTSASAYAVLLALHVGHGDLGAPLGRAGGVAGLGQPEAGAVPGLGGLRGPHRRTAGAAGWRAPGRPARAATSRARSRAAAWASWTSRRDGIAVSSAAALPATRVRAMAAARPTARTECLLAGSW